MKGRYGPYVTDGSVNATLPRDSDPTSVTLEEAVELIAARTEKGPVKKKGGRAKAPKANVEKKAPRKKTVKAKSALEPKIMQPVQAVEAVGKNREVNLRKLFRHWPESESEGLRRSSPSA